MSYLLDTDVLSQATKPAPNMPFTKWFHAQAPTSIFVSAISIFETAYGIALLPPGKRRALLENWVRYTLPDQFQTRVLAVTGDIATDAAGILSAATKSGFTIGIDDALIAATARIHNLSLVTLNRKHFRHLDVRLADF